MPAPPPPANVNRVTIAPFENRTGDVSLDALGQLVAERIIRTLAGVSGIQAVPRPVRMGPGSTSEAGALVADPGASLIVTGTYYAQGNELEFQARLLDGASGRLLHGTAPVTGLRSQPADALHVMEQKVAGAMPSTSTSSSAASTPCRIRPRSTPTANTAAAWKRSIVTTPGR